MHTEMSVMFQRSAKNMQRDFFIDLECEVLGFR